MRIHLADLLLLLSSCCEGNFDGSAESGPSVDGGAGDGSLDVSSLEDPPGLTDGQAMDDAHVAAALALAPDEANEESGPQDQSDGPNNTSGTGDVPEGVLNGSTNVTSVAPHPEQQEGAHPPSVTPPSIVVALYDGHDDLTQSVVEQHSSHASPSAAVPAIPDCSIASSSTSTASASAPPVEPIVPDAEQSADHSHSPDLQVQPSSTQADPVSSSGAEAERPLVQEATIPDLSKTTNDDSQCDSVTQVETQIDEAVSPDTTTLISGTSTVSTYGELNQLPMKSEPQAGVRTPSANRLSISYAAGTKRLVVNAEIVEKLKVFRSEGRIEVRLNIDKDETSGLSGILVSRQKCLTRQLPRALLTPFGTCNIDREPIRCHKILPSARNSVS